MTTTYEAGAKVNDLVYEHRDAGHCQSDGCARFATVIESADGAHSTMGDGYCLAHSIEARFGPGVVTATDVPQPPYTTWRREGAGNRRAAR